MNLLVIIAILLALTGFKPAGGNGDKGQATQGYYTPTRSISYYKGRKIKMNTNANLGQLEIAQKSVEVGTYFRADRTHGGQWGNDKVFYRTTYGHVDIAEYYNPLNYTTENLT